MCTNGNVTGDCYGINEGNHTGGDDVLGCSDQPTQKMGCWNGGDGQMGAKSLHVGGVHALLCDGTVRFISQNLDANLHARIIAQADGNTVSDF
jgi:hypothetical protein